MSQSTSPRTAVKVGWFLRQEKGGILHYTPEDFPVAPERMRSTEMSKTHAKSASRCPAVLNLESRYFIIRCPYDIHVRFGRDPSGKAGLKNIARDAGAVRENHLKQLLVLVPESEWRYKDRPTLQLLLEYIFVSDEPVYLNQLPPFFHYLPDPWPGTLFGGRFPIHIWPRPLMWAFEWHDVSKDLVLRRGDPLFYINFETLPQDSPVQIVEAQRTPELLSYTEMLSGVANYSNQTFSLFKEAEKRRPKVLLKPVER